MWRAATQKRKVQHVIVSGGSLCVPPLVMPQSSGENKFRKSHWNSKWQSIGIITKVSKTALRLIIAVLMCIVAGSFKHISVLTRGILSIFWFGLVLSDVHMEVGFELTLPLRMTVSSRCWDSNPTTAHPGFGR